MRFERFSVLPEVVHDTTFTGIGGCFASLWEMELQAKFLLVQQMFEVHASEGAPGGWWKMHGLKKLHGFPLLAFSTSSSQDFSLPCVAALLVPLFTVVPLASWPVPGTKQSIFAEDR